MQLNKPYPLYAKCTLEEALIGNYIIFIETDHYLSSSYLSWKTFLVMAFEQWKIQISLFNLGIKI